MRQMPRTGDLVRVRSRRWLVEDAPTIEGLATTRLACVDDDAQGEVSISLPSGAQSSLRSRLKDFLRHRRGVATKYLGSYLRWFHLTELGSVPTPWNCLNAAIGPQLRMNVQS